MNLKIARSVNSWNATAVRRWGQDEVLDSFVSPSPVLAARLLFAVGSAALLGVWLWRQSRAETAGLKAASILRASVLALCGFWSAAWVVIAFARLRYPFELEWCGGAMRDMAARVLRGQALYVAPGPGWFPYEYPPLYFWVSAFVMRIVGGEPSFAAMRLVSIVSTVGSAWLICWWTKRIGGSTTWGLIAAGIFLASYRFTGAWYDVERLDMLFLFLSLAGICLLQRSEERDSAWWAAAAAVAHVLAFLTKQQAVLFLAGGVAALAWQRKWRIAGAYGIVGAAGCAASAAALSASTDGWYWYYCFHVPMANGIRSNLAVMYLTLDLPLFAPLALMIVAGAWLSRRSGPQSPSPLLWWMAATGVAGSFLSRAHWGGDQNVLMTGYVVIGVAACTVAARLSEFRPATRAPLYGLCLAQLLALTYRPSAQLPRPEQLAAGRRFGGLIGSLEHTGPVLSLDHGSFAAEPRFHLMGLLDVAHTEKGLPKALLDALRSHVYAAIVMDAKPERGGLLQEVALNYSHAKNVGIADSWTVTGFPTPSPTRSVWVLTP